ncbi:hypothetical protein E2C01_054896 [Portunus trituberculatus]|uniref:Uncharacterized protein n=1 Tax=Portunus trituberculatus TaxID=210409 RepID=A0A5B7GUH8_PORTR|nr:hypothetical protein [Portunus trituberculatus]
MVTLFRNRLNVSKLPARRKGASTEAQFLRTIRGTLSGPYAIRGFRPARAWKRSLRRILIEDMK